MVDPTESSPKQSTVTAAPVTGGAFHRLDRQLVAAQAASMATAGRVCDACWADSPRRPSAAETREWQHAFAALLEGCGIGARDRVPAHWAEPQRRQPMPECSLWPGPRRQGAMSSASSTGGTWWNWPAGSGPPPFSHLCSLATRGQRSRTASRPLAEASGGGPDRTRQRSPDTALVARFGRRALHQRRLETAGDGGVRSGRQGG